MIVIAVTCVRVLRDILAASKTLILTLKKTKENLILLNVNNVIVLFGSKEEIEEVLVENNKEHFYF